MKIEILRRFEKQKIHAEEVIKKLDIKVFVTYGDMNLDQWKQELGEIKACIQWVETSNPQSLLNREIRKLFTKKQK